MLAPSLASPTEEVSDEEELRAIQDVDETLPGEAFARSVAKMLPLAPPDIVARLGTLNCDRYNHILQLQREATREEMVTTTMEKIRDTSQKSGLDVSAMASSAAKVKTEPIHEPSMLSESGEARHERAPSLSVRTCNICGKDVRFKATTEWKKHIYDDVLAYTCFFANCPDTRVFYEDGEGLMTHLKDRHGMDVQIYDVTCPLCVKFTTGDEEVLSRHIAQHMEEIAVAILPSGVDAGEVAEDDLRSDAISLKGDWILLNERATSPMDEMLLKQREMSPVYEKLQKERAISPEVLEETKSSKKVEPSDQKPVSIHQNDHLKTLEDLHRDKRGVRYITFKYTRNGVKTVYDIHPDFETINCEPLSHGAKLQNCIYPGALISRKGHEDLDTEREWNSIGWSLADAYPSLRGNRGLLRKAVETVFRVRNFNKGKTAFNAKEKKVASLTTEDSRKRDPCSACTSIGGGCLVLEGATRCVLCEHYQRECELPLAEAEPSFVPQSQVIFPPDHIRRSLRTTSSKEESNMTFKLGQLEDAPNSEDLIGQPRSMWSPER
ncbi:hypothetical protein J4E90_010533 [Alternaria incomplexa]|uniref:uncharacterized protein n=1 Tax=Alternaria incomplexa TaxID=1187928 RepID=UPI00221F06AE|nr:uncharacterized protein J4E90_010533 [Alternaria incomplexa]KAI4906459.1 hypothetical protein J4E90_010533 [Alternaria incomplexa]